MPRPSLLYTGQLIPYPARTAAASTADGLDYLLAVVVQGAEEHPPRKAVEAAALLTAFILLVGGGVLRTLR